MAEQNLLLFFRALACNPRSVGAIAPSGANLASLITSEITAASGPVLELGPGTGVFTEALLDELGLKANCMGRVLLNVPPASVYRITRIKPDRLADQVESDAV